MIQGWLADTVGLQNSFFLTAACELYVLWYALWGSRVTNPLPPETLRGRGGLRMEPQPVWQVGALLGEGPVWLPREQALRFVDIKGGRLHRLRARDRRQADPRSRRQPSFVLPAQDGGLLIGWRNELSCCKAIGLVRRSSGSTCLDITGPTTRPSIRSAVSGSGRWTMMRRSRRGRSIVSIAARSTGRRSARSSPMVRRSLPTGECSTMSIRANGRSGAFPSAARRSWTAARSSSGWRRTRAFPTGW